MGHLAEEFDEEGSSSCDSLTQPSMINETTVEVRFNHADSQSLHIDVSAEVYADNIYSC